jgi:uncharacterized membrane protein YccC
MTDPKDDQMDQDSLRDRLAKLHAELSDAHRDNPETHRPLGEILPDIKRLAEEPQSASQDASLPQRLERVAVQFEANHPALAGSVRRIVDLLGDIGI